MEIRAGVSEKARVVLGLLAPFRKADLHPVERNGAK